MDSQDKPGKLDSRDKPDKPDSRDKPSDSSDSSDSYLYIFQNEEWLWDESILSFFTTDEKQAVDTTLLVDLDAEPDLHPRVNHRLFFLDNKGRPIL